MSSTPLRIGLDLRPTEEGFKAHYGRGTGRYTTEIAKHLFGPREMGHAIYDDLQLVPVGSKDLAVTPFELAFYKRVPLGRATIEQQVLLPRRIGKLDLSSFHFFSHVDATARCPVPYLITVLDLIPLRFPELYKADKPNWRYKFARHLELQAIRHASGILAISEATKRDLVEMLGIAPEQVYVTPLAVNDQFTPCALEQDAVESAKAEARAQANLPSDRPVLLYVGGIDARKNVGFMLEVLQAVAEQSSTRPLLVMVGRYDRDDKYPQLLRSIRELALEEDVILTGFVPDEDLYRLYHAADVSLFPSLYEGFGFPVLESMASGVPVVAGDNSSIPEVGGDAIVRLADNDHVAWAEAITTLLSSPEKRWELTCRGLERAKEFSWERTAADTLAAYRYFSGGAPQQAEQLRGEARVALSQ